jgi:hypothetical protein
VAVLGSGIMGASVALYLARKHVHVVLVDGSAELFSKASRWNEGKIHLGYLYGADPTMNTARKLLTGGLNFPSLVEDLVGRPLDDCVVTQQDDRYVLHKESVARPEDVIALAGKISEMVRQHPDAGKYFTPLENASIRLLNKGELDRDYTTDTIVAGFEAPERSVSTRIIADYYVEALKGSERIECVLGHRVLSAKEHDDKAGGWSVQAETRGGERRLLGRFNSVVNALWEGRLAVDATAGLTQPRTWTNRYRVSVFAETCRPVDIKSAVVAVGPFGDIKNYNGKDLYLSWYNTGLLIDSNDLAPALPPVLSAEQEHAIARDTLRHLGDLIPDVHGLYDAFKSFSVKGGWVYASGQGTLSDPRSDLHSRDRIGIFSKNGYFSVDTGKYSVAPWLARQVADAIQA